MIPALAVAAATLIVLVALLATRPKQKKSTIRLAPAQRAAIQDHFRDGPTLAGSYGWSRRQYAPMHIHSKAFSSLRDQIAAQLPDHAIAFDVVFESQGKRVDWHGASASANSFILRPPRHRRNVCSTRQKGSNTHRTTSRSAPSPSTASPPYKTMIL
jgi:hypothetical protein